MQATYECKNHDIYAKHNLIGDPYPLGIKSPIDLKPFWGSYPLGIKSPGDQSPKYLKSKCIQSPIGVCPTSCTCVQPLQVVHTEAFLINSSWVASPSGTLMDLLEQFKNQELFLNMKIKEPFFDLPGP